MGSAGPGVLVRHAAVPEPREVRHDGVPGVRDLEAGRDELVVVGKLTGRLRVEVNLGCLRICL